MNDTPVKMPSILQSSNIVENTGRTVSSPGIFQGFPLPIREELLAAAVRRKYECGQLIQHRGDKIDGFSVIDKGQVKTGHYQPDGEMRVLAILGTGDSFGELACLGGFARVADAEAIGKTELLWVSETELSRVLAISPESSKGLLRIIALQLQEALDNLIVFRKQPAAKKLARTLLALCADRPAPVQVTIRHAELAELVGVTRITVATGLSTLERGGFLQRHYGKISITDPKALGEWLKRVN
jgi:CRP/FNR family transcriptional regulator, cyclic AMP receptor protein